jgi:hypothetical protein
VSRIPNGVTPFDTRLLTLGTATAKMRPKQWSRRCLILLKLLGKGMNARLIDLSGYLFYPDIH